MSGNVGRDSPYRAPCGGWARLRDFIFGCVNNFDRKDNGFPQFPDGWPRYINTTKPDRLTDPDIGTPDCPYAVPRCWDTGMFPPDCINDGTITRITNTYAIANGINVACDGTTPAASQIHYAQCHKFAFKNVQARKAWHGRYGFNEIESGIPRIGAPRYLTKRMVAEKVNSNGLGHSVTTNIERTYTVERNSGKIIEVHCRQDQVETGAEFDNGCVVPSADITQLVGLLGLDYQDGIFIGPTPGGGSLNDPDWPDLSYDEGTKSATETKIEITYSFDAADCTDDCPPECELQSASFSILIELSDPYTEQGLRDDCRGLLAWWNLEDDVVYPWRFDIADVENFPQTRGSAYAPLVTYDEKGPTSPDVFFDCGYEDDTTATGQVLGKPIYLAVPGLNRGGNDRFWDSTHKNYTYEFIDPPGNNCYRHTSWGAFAPDWCPSATQWTEDLSFQMFPPGQFEAINHFFFDDACGGAPQGFGDVLIMTKWAETLLFEWPSHNYARPCGDEDRNTIDPDSIDCDITPDGIYRWPSAPCWCNNPSQSNAPAPAACSANNNPSAVNPLNDVGKKGDWCAKTWHYDYRAYNAAPMPKPLAGALSEMICEQKCSNLSSCLKVVAIQSTSVSRPNTIGLAPTECIIDTTYGGFAIKQIYQRQVDPLWKRPKIPCDDPDHPGELDMNAVIPYEECRHCADNICNQYIIRVNNAEITTRSECEPGGDIFWEADLEVPPP